MIITQEYLPGKQMLFMKRITYGLTKATMYRHRPLRRLVCEREKEKRSFAEFTATGLTGER